MGVKYSLKLQVTDKLIRKIPGPNKDGISEQFRISHNKKLLFIQAT